MQINFLRTALAVTGLCALLAACGGGDDGTVATAPPPSTPTAPTSELPSSATQSISGLVAYLNDLIGTKTDATSSPVVLGDAVLPTSETSEPLPVN